MRYMRPTSPGVIFLCLLLTALPSVAQDVLPSDQMGNPLSGAPVLDAPFSADATTTVTRTASDGTRTEHTASAHYYRDSAGRVRVEQWTAGVDARSVGADRHVRITVAPDPNFGGVYTLHPEKRTFRLGARPVAAATTGGGGSFGVPLSTTHFHVFLTDYPHSIGDTINESLGSEIVQGVETVRTRTTTRIPSNHFGAKATEIVTERWVSPELKIVIYSRHSDPSNGVVAEYRVSNISRVEPPEQLVVIPPDYMLDRGSIEDPWISIEWPRFPSRR